MLFAPTTILSGNLKSLIASPSRKNSGLETTEKSTFEFFSISILTFSDVPTGTVDLSTIIFFSEIIFPISLAVP